MGKVRNSTESRRHGLLVKARSKTKKSIKYLTKIQKELAKTKPNISKVLKWQKISTKSAGQGVRYLDEAGALGKGECCLCN